MTHPPNAAAVLAEWSAAVFLRVEGRWRTLDPTPAWLTPFLRRCEVPDPSELFDYYPAFEFAADEAWSAGGQRESDVFTERIDDIDSPQLRMTALWVEGVETLIVQPVPESFSDHQHRLQTLRQAALERPPGEVLCTAHMLQRVLTHLDSEDIHLSVDTPNHRFHGDRELTETAFAWLIEAASTCHSAVGVVLDGNHVRIQPAKAGSPGALATLAHRSFGLQMAPYGFRIQCRPDGFEVDLPTELQSTEASP